MTLICIKAAFLSVIRENVLSCKQKEDKTVLLSDGALSFIREEDCFDTIERPVFCPKYYFKR